MIRAGAFTLALCLGACSSSPRPEPAQPADGSEVAVGSKREAEPEAIVADPEPEAPAAVDQTPTVTFYTAGGDVVIAVEVVADRRSRLRGMMYRESLEEDRGMIFVFPTEELHPFWMKNTYISLDMIHVSTQLEVVGVVERAEPLTLHQQKVDQPSKYVIEVVGGFAQKFGIAAGTRISLANVPDTER